METKQQNIGSEKAIELSESNWWELCTHREIAEFQLFTEELCCPLPVFQEAMQKSLGRPFFTHELCYSNFDSVVAEFLGKREAPTMEEVIGLIPEEKRIIMDLGGK